MGKKDELLGMSFGAASNRLRKSIMFSMAQRLGLDICFRCGEIISNVEELSVEHKEPWQLASNPIVSFFDLNNIAFSHLSCNSRAGTGGEKRWEGHIPVPASVALEQHRKWYDENKETEAYRKRNRDYQRNRYHNDSKFAEYHRTRNIRRD